MAFMIFASRPLGSVRQKRIAEKITIDCTPAMISASDLEWRVLAPRHDTCEIRRIGHGNALLKACPIMPSRTPH
jgi:hypothetical protein